MEWQAGGDDCGTPQQIRLFVGTGSRIVRRCHRAVLETINEWLTGVIVVVCSCEDSQDTGPYDQAHQKRREEHVGELVFG